MKESQEFREQIGRIDELVRKIEAVADPAVRATAKELVQALMQLHGAAIERVLELVGKAGEAGSAILKALGSDELVSSLLVLYDLHPEDFETRVNRGVAKARELLARHKTTVDLAKICDGVVWVRMQARRTRLRIGGK